jgi:hypothetical protein
MEKVYEIDYDQRTCTNAEGKYFFKIVYKADEVMEYKNAEDWLERRHPRISKPRRKWKSVEYTMKCSCGNEFLKKGTVYGCPCTWSTNQYFFFFVCEEGE